MNKIALDAAERRALTGDKTAIVSIVKNNRDLIELVDRYLKGDATRYELTNTFSGIVYLLERGRW